ncbi:hypothetical protein [Mesorhizobium sp.]|uniref:hypothetical protein n=1 Tax=Mesorhizobium sp. TaxID=1871066 RepID=UPI000FE47338|nr:hypothetical protein [Mesorhizobium sp.]RWM39902.1 MAG: hypothetical protein EOR75_12030 [Mesorhizobium sp.]
MTTTELGAALVDSVQSVHVDTPQLHAAINQLAEHLPFRATKPAPFVFVHGPGGVGKTRALDVIFGRVARTEILPFPIKMAGIEFLAPSDVGNIAYKICEAVDAFRTNSRDPALAGHFAVERLNADKNEMLAVDRIELIADALPRAADFALDVLARLTSVGGRVILIVGRSLPGRLEDAIFSYFPSSLTVITFRPFEAKKIADVVRFSGYLAKFATEVKANLISFDLSDRFDLRPFADEGFAFRMLAASGGRPGIVTFLLAHALLANRATTIRLSVDHKVLDPVFRDTPLAKLLPYNPFGLKRPPTLDQLLDALKKMEDPADAAMLQSVKLPTAYRGRGSGIIVT